MRSNTSLHRLECQLLNGTGAPVDSISTSSQFLPESLSTYRCDRPTDRPLFGDEVSWRRALTGSGG